ncbi:MAG TPA: FKBP-type peptidyl-prolyl cis-trans isomerase [Terriglobales bacterium]|nr:FKBP-type peptidyl-prolyl cis-trans isomerase [Terriglobales bacterium]
MPKRLIAFVAFSFSVAWMQISPLSAQQTPAPKAQRSSTVATKKSAGPGHTSAASKPKPLILSTQKDKVSYALGMNMAKNLQRQSVDVDADVLSRGLKDALAGNKTLLTEDEAKDTLTNLQNDMRAKQQEKMQQLGETNKKQGQDFLVANKGKEGVIALPSGLQYKILKEGTGPKPSASDSVVCNYRGTLINGTEFDSSYKRGQPATFPVNGVIKGWTEALELMPVGSKWELFVPPDLAYGERGAGADIGPNATLIFEVELLSIQGK